MADISGDVDPSNPTQKRLRMLGQSFLRINKVTALRFQAAIAAPVLLK